ncbi:thioredoxin domain-containing protein [Chryseobacterium sp.]|jgi:thiol:disulfide interchange protein|uniref:thioredoxin family protein n=1 Tax=Chryseobacterium sp. TaxID=1871047 RepID=UPI0028513AF7|nr:thioredoxin domain-containing protein [Chryseobacterium sp.]MDR3025030.1 thioredoxin family protein [Chryseobacterium sp.]
MKNIKSSPDIRFFCFFLFSMFSGSIAAQQKQAKQEINFSSGDYKNVLATAKASHRKIFVDAYATWCGPCKELQKTTFKDSKAAAYFNKNFINMSVDVEKGEGAKLAKKWGVSGLPTLLILDQNGKVIDSHTGYVDGSGLLEFAKETTGK